MTRKTAKGYTLLEVLIALSILATAITVLVGTMATNNQQAMFSYDLTIASQLARAKMIDIEYDLMKDGYSDTEKNFRGDFGREGYRDFTWSAKVEPVEIPEEARDALLAKINSQLFGAGQKQGGALQGNAAFSSMLPLLVAQMPNIINRIGQKIRRITLRVEFPYRSQTYPLVLHQYVIDKSDGRFELFEQRGANP